MYIDPRAREEIGRRQGWGKPTPKPRDHTSGAMLGHEARRSSGFAQETQDEFGRLRGDSNRLRRQLGDIASGKVSLSAEQLRQGLQQNQAAQMSMAAGARPGNAPMAAQTAAINAARLGSGLAGQQAAAGIAERQAAQQSLGSFLNAQRGMELEAALESRRLAMGGYESILAEKERRRAAEAAKGGKLGSLVGGGLGGLTGLYLGGGNPAAGAAGAQVGSGLGNWLGGGGY